MIFNVWDQIVLNREEKARAGSQLEEVMQHEPLRVLGLHNLLLLAGHRGHDLLLPAKDSGTAARSWPFGVQEGRCCC